MFLSGASSNIKDLFSCITDDRGILMRIDAFLHCCYQRELTSYFWVSSSAIHFFPVVFHSVTGNTVSY